MNPILKLLNPKRNLKQTFNAESGEWERVLSPGAGYVTVYGTGSGDIIGNVLGTQLATISANNKALVTCLMIFLDGVADDFSIEENGDQLGGGTAVYTLTAESQNYTGKTGNAIILTGTEEDPVLELAAGDVDFGTQGTDTAYVTMTYVEKPINATT